MRTSNLTVEGMHCNGCVRSVTNALKRVAGVLSADVSLTENSAKVEYDEAETTPDALRKAIQEAGYDVKE
ncbi:MAG: heavy-metal-associated domain-containing protein [Ignavibacteriota bacterium]